MGSAACIHNYPGFLGIGGRDMLRRLTVQAARYGAEIVADRVSALRKLPDGSFAAQLSDRAVPAAHVLLATGIVDRCPPIDGEPRGGPSDLVRFCPICDGFEAIDRRVAVLGDSESGGQKALFLRTYTRTVSLFLTDGGSSDADRLAQLRAAGVTLAGRVETIARASAKTLTIVTQDGERHAVDAVYPALGCDVRSELATALGAAATRNGSLQVDDHQRTTVDGLYAAGDVVTDLHQLSVAFGHAAIAATDIHSRLPDNPR